MKRKLLLFLCFFCGMLHLHAQQDVIQEKKDILKVVQQFFDAMEARDTVTFSNTALPDAYHYYVKETKDSVLAGARPQSLFKQSLAANKRVVKEHFRNTGVTVQVHKRIAMVWGPYDLWADKKFSHCGIDVFTLLKTKDGWKIASIAYSVEPEECDKEIK